MKSVQVFFISMKFKLFRLLNVIKTKVENTNKNNSRSCQVFYKKIYRSKISNEKNEANSDCIFFHFFFIWIRFLLIKFYLTFRNSDAIQWMEHHSRQELNEHRNNIRMHHLKSFIDTDTPHQTPISLMNEWWHHKRIIHQILTTPLQSQWHRHTNPNLNV